MMGRTNSRFRPDFFKPFAPLGKRFVLAEQKYLLTLRSRDIVLIAIFVA